MNLLRTLARPMLASMFVTGGLDALLNPGPKVDMAEEVAPAVRSTIPGMSEQDTESIVRINGGVQLVAGTMLAFGRLPRLSALALAASLVPTTAAGHRYWEFDESERPKQRIHFYKNVSMLGGLLLASMDTEGRPGVAWRTRHSAEHAGAALRRSRGEARRAAKAAKIAAAGATKGMTNGQPGLVWRARHGAEQAGLAARRTGRDVRRSAKTAKVLAKAKIPG